MLLGLALQEFLDRSIGVNSAKLLVITKDFLGNFASYSFLGGHPFHFRGDCGGVPLLLRLLAELLHLFMDL